MKSLHVIPSEENVIKAFCENIIDRDIDVIRFCNMLNAIDGSYTISIDAPWGSGKTFFIKQAKLLLDYLNVHVTKSDYLNSYLENFKTQHMDLWSQLSVTIPHATVYYDAWENDNDTDPILSLIYAVIQSNQSDFEIAKSRKTSEIVGAIAGIITGRRVNDLFNSIEGEDTMQIIKAEKSIAEFMKEFINHALIEHGNRLVIFIDELDRCKPTFAVKLLERIKHFFSDERVTFVFSVNSEQLQHTIRNYYGVGFDANRYLDKFFDLRIPLPEVNYEEFLSSIGLPQNSFIYDKMCHIVIKYFEFQLREIAKFVQHAKTAAYKPTHKDRDWGFSDGRAIGFCMYYIVPILIGLKIADINMYHEFVQGHNPKILIEILAEYEPALIGKRGLLANGETLNKEEASANGLNYIDFNQRLEEVYNALFATHYSYDYFSTDIGEMTFNADTQKQLMSILSLFSPYADFSF